MTTLNNLNTYLVKDKFVKEFLVRSWWVYAFVILNLIGFSIALNQADHKYFQLNTTYLKLDQALQDLKKNQNRLTFQIKSLEDQKSVEMILKKELGLISEGQTKVYFINP